MITMTITEDGEFIDEITFDAANLVARDGGITVIHSDVMQECTGDGLWHWVARAAYRRRARQSSKMRSKPRSGAKLISRPRCPSSTRRRTFRPIRAMRSEMTQASAQSSLMTTSTNCSTTWTRPTRISASAPRWLAATSGCRGAGRPTVWFPASSAVGRCR
jgi:hypothetical protein